MKTLLVAFVVGIVVLAVVGICVLALVTSTTRGTEWLVGGRDHEAGSDLADSSPPDDEA